MLDLIINGGGLISKSLTVRLEAAGHEVHRVPLPELEHGAAFFKSHCEELAGSGRYYSNMFIDLTYGFDEADAFDSDAVSAKDAVQSRIGGILRALKYGSQHMARAVDGGKIWVLCLDHSVSMSVSSPANPVTNYAAMSAVQCVAKEIMNFDVKVNLFLIHPPRESIDALEWREAKNDLHVYGLRYKPQPVDHMSETLHMYSELKQLTTTGALIPLGSGISIANF